MRIMVLSSREIIDGTPAEIVGCLTASQMTSQTDAEYMRASAKRAKIYSGRTVRPWSAELFLTDMIKSKIIVELFFEGELK